MDRPQAQKAKDLRCWEDEKLSEMLKIIWTLPLQGNVSLNIKNIGQQHLAFKLLSKYYWQYKGFRTSRPLQYSMGFRQRLPDPEESQTYETDDLCQLLLLAEPQLYSAGLVQPKPLKRIWATGHAHTISYLRPYQKHT